MQVQAKKLPGEIHKDANYALRCVVFPKITRDSVVEGIRYDKLVINYGNWMCDKHTNDQDPKYIRASLRRVGKFLQTMKELRPEVKELRTILDPEYYNDVIEAVKIQGKYDPHTRKYATPANATWLSTALLLLCELDELICIKDKDKEKPLVTADFKKLLKLAMATAVNKKAVESQVMLKRHKKTSLPILADIQKLHKHFNAVRTEAFGDCQSNFSYSSWLTLAKATSTSLQVFNRRRPGEIERMLIEDFENHEKIQEVEADQYKRLSEKARKIADNYVRVVMRGKLNRNVPALLSKELFDCIQYLIDSRRLAKIPSSNPYVFGLPSTGDGENKWLNACDMLRAFSNECGAAVPSNLRATVLRKHIATHCVTLNLQEYQVSELADWMGHADKIHKDKYRQTMTSREILHMSKLLINAQGLDDDENDSVSESESHCAAGTEETNSDLSGPSQKHRKRFLFIRFIFSNNCNSFIYYYNCDLLPFFCIISESKSINENRITPKSASVVIRKRRVAKTRMRKISSASSKSDESPKPSTSTKKNNNSNLFNQVLL